MGWWNLKNNDHRVGLIPRYPDEMSERAILATQPRRVEKTETTWIHKMENDEIHCGIK